MAISYCVRITVRPGHSTYEAVVVREYFSRSVFPYVTSRRVWYVPVSSLDYDDYRQNRNQYRFRKWLMQKIKGVQPDEIVRY